MSHVSIERSLRVGQNLIWEGLKPKPPCLKFFFLQNYIEAVDAQSKSPSVILQNPDFTLSFFAFHDFSLYRSFSNAYAFGTFCVIKIQCVHCRLSHSRFWTCLPKPFECNGSHYIAPPLLIDAIDQVFFFARNEHIKFEGWSWIKIYFSTYAKGFLIISWREGESSDGWRFQTDSVQYFQIIVRKIHIDLGN